MTVTDINGALLCFAVPSRAVPCRAVPCCAVLCCAELCCAVLCCLTARCALKGCAHADYDCMLQGNASGLWGAGCHPMAWPSAQRACSAQPCWITSSLWTPRSSKSRCSLAPGSTKYVPLPLLGICLLCSKFLVKSATTVPFKTSSRCHYSD